MQLLYIVLKLKNPSMSQLGMQPLTYYTISHGLKMSQFSNCEASATPSDSALSLRKGT